MLLARSHPCIARTLYAAPNSHSIQVICKNTNEDTKLRVDKFFELVMSVRDCDIDQYGVVSHVVYASYIAKAREELAACLGFSTSSIACSGNALAVSELKLNYFRPLKLGAKFVVKVRLVAKGARVLAEHFIETLPDRELVLEAKATIVCLNEEHRPTRVFPEMSTKVLGFFTSPTDNGQC